MGRRVSSVWDLSRARAFETWSERPSLGRGCLRLWGRLHGLRSVHRAYTERTPSGAYTEMDPGLAKSVYRGRICAMYGLHFC